MSDTRVVNVLREKADVYIGRPTPWGNPFRIGRHGSRSEVLEKYRSWILHPAQQNLRARMERELRGFVLGCYCKPKPCHGDIIVEVIDP